MDDPVVPDELGTCAHEPGARVADYRAMPRNPAQVRQSMPNTGGLTTAFRGSGCLSEVRAVFRSQLARVPAAGQEMTRAK